MEATVVVPTKEEIPTEHERQFFPDIHTFPQDIISTSARSVMLQAYLEDEKRTRIRESISNGRCSYTMTWKTGSGISRSEKEQYITEKEFGILLTEATCFLNKIRYYYRSQGVGFQFNVYYGPLFGYTQIEKEFPSAEEALAFVPPAWFGPEVTNDRAHGNFSLAKYGKPI